MPEEDRRIIEPVGRSSFSGADINVHAMVAGDSFNTNLKSLDSVQVITISSFREKVPVRGLGNTNVLSYVRGPRNYAGSLITTVIEKHPLYNFITEAIGNPPERDHDYSYDERQRRSVGDSRYNPDQLPPLNFILSFSNELGNRASVVIYGVEFVHNGMTMAIEDMLTENTYQFVARDAVVLIDPRQEAGAGFEWIDTESIDDPESWSDPSSIAQNAAIVYGQRINDWTGYIPSTASPKSTKTMQVPSASTSINKSQVRRIANEQWGGYKPSTG